MRTPKRVALASAALAVVACVQPLTAPKARALVESADLAAPDAPEWITARDTAVLALLYGSGLRISEALSLTRREAPIKGRDMLRVTGKGGKTRVVPVLPIVREAVEPGPTAPLTTPELRTL